MNIKNTLTIGILLLVVGLLSYFLYQDNDISKNTKNTKKQTKQTNIVMLDSPNKSLNTAILNQNIENLKKMLSNTRSMLKTYNINNPNNIISNNEIDKLVSLDLERINKETNIINNDLIENNYKKEKTIEDNIIENEKTNHTLATQSTKTLTQTTTSSTRTNPTTTKSSSGSVDEDLIKKHTEDENIRLKKDKQVQTEVTKLKIQIADVKKIIEKISSTIQ